MGDYRKDAIDELKCINALRAAAQNCRDRLKELDAELTRMKAVSLQTDPVQGGGNKTEERWCNIVNEKDKEREKLRPVLKRLQRFDRAWAVLSERDRNVLTDWYIESGQFDRADRVVSNLGCSRSTAFNWRDDAIINFTRAWCGAVVT